MSKSRRTQLQLINSDESPVKSGKVSHDARGNAVWDWDIATGVLACKSVAELISSLDAPDILSLDGEPEQTPDWCGDPYNRTSR
jgi:hypothetical protein